MKKKNNKKWISALSCFCATLLAFVGFSALIKPKTNRIEAAALSKDEYNIADYEWANYFNFANVDPYANGYFSESKCTITKGDNSLSFTFLQDVSYNSAVNITARSCRLSTDVYNSETGVLPDITEFDTDYIFTCDGIVYQDSGVDSSTQSLTKIYISVSSSTSDYVTWVENSSFVYSSYITTSKHRMYLDFPPGSIWGDTYYAGWTYELSNFALYKGTEVYDYTPYFYSLESLPGEDSDSGSGDSSSGDSDSSTDKPTGDYEQGFQDGLGTAKYSFFYGTTLDLSVLNSSGTITNSYTSVPFGYVQGGISLSPLVSWLSEKGHTVDNSAGVRLTLTFSDPISGALFHVQGVGKDDAFLNQFEAVVDNGNVYPARFVAFEDKLGYGLQTQSGTFITNGFTALQKWDIYGLNNLADLFLLDYTTDYNNGYSAGFEAGEKQGYENGEDVGYDNGYKNGKSSGYDQGWKEGLNQGLSDDPYGFSDFAFTLLDMPGRLLANFLNFEIFGSNFAGLVASLLTVMIVFFVVKRL